MSYALILVLFVQVPSSRRAEQASVSLPMIVIFLQQRPHRTRLTRHQYLIQAI